MTPHVREHREGQVERLLLVLMGARLALGLVSFGVGVVLDVLAGEEPATQWPGFYVTVAFCFLATLVYRPFVGQIRRPGVFGAINVVTDLALVTALVVFSGGRESVFTFLYVGVVLYGGVLFPGWGAFLCAGASAVGYGLILALARQGWLSGPELGVPMGVLATGALVHASAFMAAAGLASYLARELVQAGEALDERTQDLRHLLALHQRTVESLKSGLLTTDLEGRITSFNQEAQRITGLSRSQATGRPVDELLPGLHDPGGAADRGDAAARARMEYVGPAGEQLHLGYATYVLRDAAGEPDGEVVIFQDVTEVVAMERRLRRSVRLAAAGELSASIAHEIRNPLAAISGSIQMMHADLDATQGESKRLMEIVVREVDRLDRLIGDFLQFARPAEPKLEPVAVDDVVAGVVEMFETARPEGVEIETSVEPELRVRADAGQLRQVLWNLVLNAAQAMPEGGVVRIEAGSAPAPPQEELPEDRRQQQEISSWAELSVLDQGAGIPADVLEHMFDPFFTTKQEGTGLGLATVHRVVEEHGGLVRVTRTGGRFATAIRLALPQSEGAA